MSCVIPTMYGPVAKRSARPVVLLIDGDAPFRRNLRILLAGSGYRVEEAETGCKGLQAAERLTPSIVILDLGLPDMDGQDVICSLREWLQSPIVVLSSRDHALEKITALDQGADDYLIKPCNSGELLARLRVALRHAAMLHGVGESPMFATGDLQVDLISRRVFVRGEHVHITPIEYKLLAALVRNAGRALTHKYLLKEAWGPKQVQEPQYLRVFMAALRRKIEADPAQPCHLLTEQGVGYRLACCSTD